MTDHNESGHDEHSHGSTSKFLTVFAALTPLLLAELVAPESLWCWSSLLLALVLAGYGFRVVRERFSTPADRRLPTAYVTFIYAVGAAAVLALLANASGLLLRAQAGPYLVTLLWLLLGVAANFLRFLRVLASRA